VITLSNRRLRAVVRVDTADNGSGRAVDCAAVADALTHRTRQAGGGAPAVMLTALADALRSGTIAVPVNATAVEADSFLVGPPAGSSGKRRACPLVMATPVPQSPGRTG
jgi:hypothetical protein